MGAEAAWSLQCKVEESEGRYPPRTDFNIKSQDLKTGEAYIGNPAHDAPVYIPFYKEWNETFWISRETGEFLHIRPPESWAQRNGAVPWTEKGHCELKTTDLKF